MHGKRESFTLAHFTTIAIKKSLKEILLSLNIGVFNKNIYVLELGCLNLLCHNWHLFELEAQTKTDADLFLSCADNCSGKRRPHFGPFASYFPDAWSCTTQPKRENETEQPLSTSWPTDNRFVDYCRDRST